ncbi:aldo/keto reductase [Klebsiella pneumoniae]|nr:aldo/keto reductase [Klebsiella pneumoniae]
MDAALRQRQSVIARRQYCQQKLQVELIGRSQWTVRYRQRLQQLAETDIAVWLYGEPGTGRMTGARYLHQLGRHAEGPFIACELTPANAHTLNELIAQAQGGTLVLSHPEHLTHEQQHQLVQLQSHEKRPFRLIGIGSASLVELAASSQIVAELYYIDVYQMHHIDRHTPWEEIWQAMELLVQQGKVLYIGSSNFAGWDIATAQSVATVRHFLGLVAEQSLYNLTARTVELELIPACRHFGLGLIPWSPLAGGLLGGVLKKMASGRRARPAFARLIEQYRPQLEAYEGLCEDLGETPSDVALAWLLQNPVVTAPLIGPRTVEQLQQALHATTITLSDDTMSCLDEIWPGPGGEAPQAYAW